MASSLNPPSSDTLFDLSPPGTQDFNEVQKNFNQTATTWIIISVISSLVGLGIIGFIAYKCAKNGRKVIVQDLQTVAAAYNRPHNTNTVPVWEVTAPTMENFLQEMAKEKPVRFTAQQLFSFTNNYSNRLGSGGFGSVYKGVGSTDSLDWFPKHVWEEYEKGELGAVTLACGIEEKDEEKAERMSKVALWCVQDSPEGRPPMSAVVKMLEGGVEIVPPPKPFQYLFSLGMAQHQSKETTDGSSYSTSEESQSRWYKETTPIMAKYEIQMASSI
ncbi:hypothetical protein Patl1_12699 [Pistacia atlantica]|uniref:Uncharacterized protein n=1 Tax=Pistacia atlantica TaxID=434234 RepID=A0ACC1ASU1_9ROSI|nr:hypothetical protein Patl1_12699 [Pistacia atlantica]